MRSVMLLTTLGIVIATAGFGLARDGDTAHDVAGFEDVAGFDDVAASADVAFRSPRDPWADWVRPEGPIRVALQAGHWKAAEAPDEQARLRTNGTRGGGKAEWEVNLGIARHTAEILEQAGYAVDILPTTIPPAYFADLFISIHADGSTSSSAAGFRAAAPRRDRTGRAAEFAELLNRTYGSATGLRYYPLITRRMTSYYAFNSRRYHHALHPMTVGVIIETGFLTNPGDRRIIVSAQDRAAHGIARAVLEFLPLDAVEDGPVAASTTEQAARP